MQIDWAFGLRYSRLTAQQHPLHAEILRAGAIFAKILSPQLTQELRLLLSRLRSRELDLILKIEERTRKKILLNFFYNFTKNTLWYNFLNFHVLI